MLICERDGCVDDPLSAHTWREGAGRGGAGERRDRAAAAQPGPDCPSVDIRPERRENWTLCEPKQAEPMYRSQLDYQTL